MTRGVDKRGVLVQSLALAIAATFFSSLYFHYMIFMVPGPAGFKEIPNPWGFLLVELFALFIICFFGAVIGLSFSKKYELPGLGDLKDFTGSLSFILALGTVMIMLSYFLFDRYFYEISPLCYPKDLLYLITLPFQGAFTDEIILRLCLVTICVGLFKGKTSGVVCVSALASLFTIKYLYFFGIKPGVDYLFLVQILLSFVSNCLLGYLFVTQGLVYSMALKFLFGLKYFVVYWATGA